MSIPLYVLTLHFSWASICVSIGPYICLSSLKKPFYCLTSKMRWFTLTQNYKYWEWDKILYFEKNQTLLLLFLMSLIFFKMQNFTSFSIFIIIRKGRSPHFACQTVKWLLNVWQTDIWTNKDTDRRSRKIRGKNIQKDRIRIDRHTDSMTKSFKIGGQQIPCYLAVCHIQTYLDTEHNMKHSFSTIGWLLSLYACWIPNSTNSFISS